MEFGCEKLNVSERAVIREIDSPARQRKLDQPTVPKTSTPEAAGPSASPPISNSLPWRTNMKRARVLAAPA